MSDTTLVAKSERLVSLDVFRGITIAGMILVNNPGNWRHIYSPLRHATWNGCTPTDLVFPFFLFIVGVAMTFSFRRRLERGSSRAFLLAQVIRRTIILFLLGLIMYGFPDFRLIGPYISVIVGLVLLYADEPVFGWGPTGPARARKIAAGVLLIGGVIYFAADFGHFQETSLRVPGVLQRIAVCYFLASIIMLTCGVWGRAAWALALIVGYWLIVKCVSPPADYVAHVTGSEGLLHDWIDVKLLGRHLYHERPDPEGLLSTLPAIATTLLGVLTGHWLLSARDRRDKVVGLFVLANVALVAGLCMNYGFPLNKKIWSSSYVVFTAGLALHFLAMCYWLIDVRGYKLWAWPFVVFGTNAIVVYVASSLVAKVMYRCEVTAADGTVVSFKTWVYEHLFATWAAPTNASLLYAVTYIVIWCLLLVPLYRRRIFIRI